MTLTVAGLQPRAAAALAMLIVSANGSVSWFGAFLAIVILQPLLSAASLNVLNNLGSPNRVLFLGFSFFALHRVQDPLIF
jgi:hypothetical protein